MEKQEKKNDVQRVEKVETAVKEVPVAETETSSYVRISDLTKEQIKSFNCVKGLFVPKVSKFSKSYTYEFSLHENGLIINPLGNNGRDRENISLDEFNAVRLYNKKLDLYFLTHEFEGPIYYRLVKGEKQDGSLYYSVQYWLVPGGKCHTHFFSGTEISFMKGLQKLGLAKFNFILKPKDIDEEENSNNLDNLDEDIL